MRWSRPVADIPEPHILHAFTPVQASASCSPRVYSGAGVRLIEDGEYRPAGGRASRTEAVRTLGVPEAPEALRTIHIYPQDYEGVQRSPAHTRLDVALAGAQPGDLRGGCIGVVARGSSHLVVRRCEISNVLFGIYNNRAE